MTTNTPDPVDYWTARKCAERAADLLARADQLAQHGADKKALEPIWEQVRHWLAVGGRFTTLDHLQRSVPPSGGEPR